MNDPALRDSRPSSHPDHLVLLQEDLSPQLDHLLRDLISNGQRRLTIDHADGRGPASFAVGHGLRLYGDGGILNASTVRPVVEASVREADAVFDLDLAGLENFAFLSWVAVLRATQRFRARKGVLRVHARGSTRRLVEMAAAIEVNRTNLEIT
jgi:hypothetical protein